MEVEFKGEDEANAITFRELKDALNKRDEKNMVTDLIAIKSKDDQKKFIILVL